MNKNILLITILLPVSIFCQSYEIGIDPSSEPFFQIIEEIYEGAGFTVTKVVQPSQRSIFNANEGKLDGESLRVFNIDKEFPNLMKIPTPIFHIVIRGYSKKGALKLTSIADLKGKKVAVIRGMQAATNIATQAGAEIIFTKDPSALLNMINSGRVEVGVNTETVMAPLLSNFPDIESHEPPLLTIPLHTWVHKKNADIIPKLDKVIKEWGPDLILKKITALAEANN